MAKRCDYGKIVIQSPEMVKLAFAAYSLRDALVEDNHPELNEFASESAESSEKIDDIFNRVNQALGDMLVFFEVDLSAYDFLESYEAKSLQSTNQNKG